MFIITIILITLILLILFFDHLLIITIILLLLLMLLLVIFIITIIVVIKTLFMYDCIVWFSFYLFFVILFEFYTVFVWFGHFCFFDYLFIIWKSWEIHKFYMSYIFFELNFMFKIKIMIINQSNWFILSTINKHSLNSHLSDRTINKKNIKNKWYNKNMQILTKTKILLLILLFIS